MATIRQRPSGKWQAEVYRNGIRKAGTFPTKRVAATWAARMETELADQVPRRIGDDQTVGHLLDRYRREVTPAKRGARWEAIRLLAIGRSDLASVNLSALSATDLARWRDERLRSVAPGSVRREMVLLGSVLNRAVKEWRVLAENPLRDVSRPKEPPARERRISEGEIAALAHVTGFDPAGAGSAVTVKQRMFAAFLFAIETAMRCGEICALRRSNISGANRTARIVMSKNGRGRDVPLSSAALAIINRLPEGEGLFDLTTGQVDASFRKARDAAAIDGLHFHDTRHEAISRLAAKMDVLDLARMVGHRDLNMLLRYYHKTASDLAKQLD